MVIMAVNFFTVILMGSFSYLYFTSGHNSGEKWIFHSMSDTVLSIFFMIINFNIILSIAPPVMGSL